MTGRAFVGDHRAPVKDFAGQWAGRTVLTGDRLCLPSLDLIHRQAEQGGKFPVGFPHEQADKLDLLVGVGNDRGLQNRFRNRVQCTLGDELCQFRYHLIRYPSNHSGAR